MLRPRAPSPRATPLDLAPRAACHSSPGGCGRARCARASARGPVPCRRSPRAWTSFARSRSGSSRDLPAECVLGPCEERPDARLAETHGRRDLVVRKAAVAEREERGAALVDARQRGPYLGARFGTLGAGRRVHRDVDAAAVHALAGRAPGPRAEPVQRRVRGGRMQPGRSVTSVAGMLPINGDEDVLTDV